MELAGEAGPRLRVGFVLADRFTLIAFAGFVDAIRLAADEGDRSRPVDCSWAVLGDPNQEFVSSCGVMIRGEVLMEQPDQFDYIVVVGGLLHGGQKVSPGTYSFLRHAAGQGTALVGLCTGSFILARAGLLDGYQACVSWFHREEFAAEFPDLRHDSDRMFVIDRDRLTCAGGTSVVHLASHLIEKHCSRDQALKSLRIMVEEQPLPSGAWQPEAIVTRQAQDGLVRAAMLRIERNLAFAEPLTTLAAALRVSVRHLERRFLADVGLSPRDYRQRLRLARARWMIEHSGRTITAIGHECGFDDSAYFSRAFRKQFGLSPSALRREKSIPSA